MFVYIEDALSDGAALQKYADINAVGPRMRHL